MKNKISIGLYNSVRIFIKSNLFVDLMKKYVKVLKQLD